MIEKERIDKKDFEFFFNAVAIFSRYDYWKKELWRKLPGRKKTDEAEVHVAMLHYWSHNHFGFYSSPCGSAWATIWMDLPEYGIKACTAYDEYIADYQDIISDYAKWCESQR